MKKILMVLGGIFLVFVIAGIIGFTLLAKKGDALDEQSKTYVEKVVPEILSDLRPATLLKYSSSELIDSANKDEIDKLFKWYGKLGKYKQMGDVVGGSNINYSQEKGKVVSAQYQINTEFETGPATIILVLIQRDDKWQIYNFKINSKAFVTQ
ncbi:MAG: hypothetical protein C0625_13840 [Arcobacter sp.]|nr:MAG: hypothetical protein C0625_13840 [Arcobacter sp.]